MKTIASIGKAVTGILEGKVKRKEEVRMNDINISKKTLYELVEKTIGKHRWEMRNVNTARAMKVATEKLKQHTANLENIYSFVYRAALAGEYGQLWKPDEDDNRSFGLILGRRRMSRTLFAR